MLLASLLSVSEIILSSVPYCSIVDLALLSTKLIFAPVSVLVNVAQVLTVPELTARLPVIVAPLDVANTMSVASLRKATLPDLALTTVFHQCG